MPPGKEIMMKRILTTVIFAVGLFCFVTFVDVATAHALQSVDPINTGNDSSTVPFKPDRDLVQAVARKDIRAVGQLLDVDFTWTDSQGRTLTRTQVLEKLPVPALGDESQVSQQERVGSQIVTHRVERGKIYVLRVWVKRPAGWRALVYQEVRQLGASPQSNPGIQDCENPCKTVPFKPQTEDEREVIQAYQQVETAVTAHDSAAWGAHMAEEFFAVTDNSDRPLDKPSRMAGLDQQKQAGIPPLPLVSARMFQFGDTMVMTSRQQPLHGKPLHVTRIWVKQKGKWVELLSYQTTIQTPVP
jgi:hypothetical protein